MKERKNAYLRNGILVLLLTAAFLAVPVSAVASVADQGIIHPVTPLIPEPTPTPIPSEERIAEILAEVDPVTITNLTDYIAYNNEKMGWGLSESEIAEAVAVLEQDASIMKNDGRYRTPNYQEFRRTLGTVLGLTKIQTILFETADEKERQERRIETSRLLHEDTTPERGANMPGYVNPSSQSAPVAKGDVYYLYIFVDFTIDGSDGPWTVSDRNTALDDAYIGTHEIRNQAPNSAGITNQGGYLTVLVSGENEDKLGAYASYNYVDGPGWIEVALYNIGYRDTNNDGFISDDVARTFKSRYDVDSVIIVYFTHDFGGAYAVRNGGYGERCVVSFWGNNDTNRDESIPESYQHEILHLFGATDEYPADHSGINYYSDFAVSPINQYYRNTNHHNASNHIESVMCNHRDTNRISQSTRNFIGWGDMDNDGIIDAVEI